MFVVHTSGFLFEFVCTVHICMHMHSTHCVCVHHALMSLCSHISIHATTAQAPLLINFALPFKKPYQKFPIRFNRPLVHIKRPIYTDPLSLKLFFKGKILFCALLVSKACQHSRESTTNIKVA